MGRESFSMEVEVEDGRRKWCHHDEGLHVFPLEWDHHVIGVCRDRFEDWFEDWIGYVGLERALFVAASNKE